MAIYKDVEPLKVVSYQGENEDFDRGVKFILEKLDALPTVEAGKNVGRFIDPVKAIKKIAECIKNPPKNLSGDILNEYLMGLKVAGGCITETPSEDVISRAVFDQFKWERDMAFKTLEEHGLSLGIIKEE